MPQSSLISLQPHRILVCQQRQIGDVLLATPALKLLRKRFPEAEIHVVTEGKCAPMLENNPHVDHIWRLGKQDLPTLWHELRWYWRLARQRYDLLINFQPTLPRLRWLLFFSRAEVRLAGRVPWYLRPFYTHFADWLEDLIPDVEEYLEGSCEAMYAAKAKALVLRDLGITWSDERPKLFLTKEERLAAVSRLKALGLDSRDTLISIAPAHKRVTRRWPVQHYVKMIEILIGKAKREGITLRFLLLWGPGEAETIRELVALAREKNIAHSLLVPESMPSLREMAACMERAVLHIGNCSAPRHIAVAVDTPTCIVHGATGPEWVCPPHGGQPQDHVWLCSFLDCQPCERNKCRKVAKGPTPCLVSLPPDRMAQTAFELIKRYSGNHPFFSSSSK